ncbi:HalOD1 output domain-containing protein [Halomarina rubra]|uniref:HalOD1 output domain-containing protein n=1 Tax=Halomarina rubra TaxID=2071873 RepID=A0ABD6AWY3_9EURY|nr:HalOD1 output domain-containing protein [Halomarina rubra]
MDRQVRMVVELERSAVPPSEVVAEGLARANGIEAVDLDVTLFDYVDPSSLDRVFVDRRPDAPRDGWVSFPVEGYRVTVANAPADAVTVRVEAVGEVLDERATVDAGFETDC